MKLFLKSSGCVLISFFLMYFYDWVSDLLVLHGNYQLKEEVRSELNENDTLAELETLGVPRQSFINSIPSYWMGLMLIISTLLTLPKLRHLKDVINIQCIMENPHTETSDVQVDIETVVRRHDASLIESATESAVQVVFQWGSYMGLIYLIDKSMYAIHQNANFVCSDEQHSFLMDAFCRLN